MAVKRRLLEFVPRATYTSNYSGTQSTKVHWITGRQETASDRTQFHELRRMRKEALSRKRKYLPPWFADYVGGLDVGSEFSTLKHSYVGPGAYPNAKWRSNVNQAGSIFVEYDGPLLAKASDVGSTSVLWPVLSGVDRQTIHAKGTTAIARTLPTNPAAGLGVALGELRAGMPKMIGHTLTAQERRGPRSGASEYLNVEFGWKPLIQDVTSTARALRNSAEILAQYERDSGKHIRRRYRFPRDVTTEVTMTPNQVASPTLNAYHYNGVASGTLERTRVTTTETWFSGCFTYYLSAGDTAKSRLKKAEQQAAKLLGIRLTPDLLYQLAPWSWLVDWNSNLGDVIRNVSAFSQDGLVMRWGYVMCTKTITDTYRLPSVVLRNGQRAMDQTFSTTQKVRYKATPYGFGLDAASFSTRQWAILAALGIARGPRQL